MMGKNHVVVGFSVTTAGTVAMASASGGPAGSFGSRFGTAALSVLFPERVSVGLGNGIAYEAFMFLFAAAFFLWVGCLLPDADSSESTFGKVFHLPFKHRTWTHSVWALALMLLLAASHPWFRFLLLGYALHLLADWPSSAGICFLYPCRRFREYPNGGIVADGHVVRLYRTNHRSERNFVAFVVIACICICALCRNGFIFFFEWIWY